MRNGNRKQLIDELNEEANTELDSETFLLINLNVDE